MLASLLLVALVVLVGGYGWAWVEVLRSLHRRRVTEQGAATPMPVQVCPSEEVGRFVPRRVDVFPKVKTLGTHGRRGARRRRRW